MAAAGMVPTTDFIARDVNHVFQYFPDKSPQEHAAIASNSLPNVTPSVDPSPPLLHMMDPSWPPHLPQAELLYHLVDTFFGSVPLAHRVIHRPSFMASLLEPPSSRKFPQVFHFNLYFG